MDNSGFWKMKDLSYFKCGSCEHSFANIGSLHEHLFEHVEDGSYCFRGKTRTAFPKYEPRHSCTQTDDASDLDFDILCNEYVDLPNDSLTENDADTDTTCIDVKGEVYDGTAKTDYTEKQDSVTKDELAGTEMKALNNDSELNNAIKPDEILGDKLNNKNAYIDSLNSTTGNEVETYITCIDVSNNISDSNSDQDKKQDSFSENDLQNAEIKAFSAVLDSKMNTGMNPVECLVSERIKGNERTEEICVNSANKTDLVDDEMPEPPVISDMNPNDKTKQDEVLVKEVKRKRGRPKRTSENSVKDKIVKKENEELDLDWKPDMHQFKIGPTRIHRTRRKTKELNESVEPDPETKAKLDRLLIRKRATPRDKTKIELGSKIKRRVGRPKEVFDSSYITEENRGCMVEYKENDAEDDNQDKNKPKKYVFLRTQLECKYCHKYFMSYYLPLHLKKIHGEKEGCVRCDICFKWIPAHRKRDHDKDIHNILKPRLHGELTYQCSKCGIVMKKENKYRHEKCHSEDGRYTRHMVCEVCGVVCSSLTAYTSHSRSHSKTKYQCDRMDCSFVCISKTELEKHKARHEASLPCSVCGKLFMNKTHVKKHIRSVHMGEKSHKCSKCFKSFKSKYNMMEHYQAQHTGTCFTCSTCGRVFKHSSSLQKHLPIHTGHRRYICHLCNHGFIQSTPYWLHMEKKHGMSKEEAVAIRKQHIAEQNEQKISQS